MLPACRELAVEILLVCSQGVVLPEGLAAEIRVVRPAEDAPQALRAAGLREATGDVIVLSSDADAVGQDWSSLLLHRAGVVAAFTSDPADGPDPTPVTTGLGNTVA